MSKVLITGGAGYIGTMLSTKLLSLGHKVTVVDLLKYDKGSLNHLYFNKNFKLICDDVRKKNLMKKLVKKHDFLLISGSNTLILNILHISSSRVLQSRLK